VELIKLCGVFGVMVILHVISLSFVLIRVAHDDEHVFTMRLEYQSHAVAHKHAVLCCVYCVHEQVVAGVCDAADATTTAFSRMALTLAEIARVRTSYVTHYISVAVFYYCVDISSVQLK
jgi:hypothetical protein